MIVTELHRNRFGGLLILKGSRDDSVAIYRKHWYR